MLSGVSKSNDTLYNTIGVVLAIISGFFIGISFIIKKKGLLNANAKTGEMAGDGHAYLKSKLWWTGMILMAVGELCNFVAYAFTAALIVTPLGALSVVISAVLSSIVLKERLNTQGKIGCGLCVVGAIIIVLHAPPSSPVNDIESFMKLVIQPAFLVYMVLVLIATLILTFHTGPRYGRTHMLVYISICSIVGSVAVVFTQGFGAAIVYSATVSNQFTHWFVYITLLMMVITQIVEINYLNKALNIFNTAMVTPVYYVVFTTSTIIASAVLFQGFKASGLGLATIIAGFFVIVAGVGLLQLSKGSSNPAEITIPLSTSPTQVMSFNGSSEMILSKGDAEEKGTLRGIPVNVPTRPTSESGTLSRAVSMHAELEAGPMALRANPFQSFRRSKVIIEDIAEDRRTRARTSMGDSTMSPIRTAEGRHMTAPGVFSNLERDAPQSEKGVPAARVKKGRMGAATTDKNHPVDIWHHVRTLHSDEPIPPDTVARKLVIKEAEKSLQQQQSPPQSPDDQMEASTSTSPRHRRYLTEDTFREIKESETE